MLKTSVVRIVGISVMLLSLIPISMFAVMPQFWEQSSFHDFLQGKVTSCSISHEGRVTLAPDLMSIVSTDQVLIWSMVADAAGNLYLGTGHSGKVFRLDSTNQDKLFYTAQELDVFALAVDRKNNLLVGTSPDGKVYKVTPGGSASEFFNPHAKYIWSLAFDRDGNLFVGTGDQGKIYKVDATGKGTVFYETKQTHVMALKVDAQNNLLAGTYSEGILYRISPAGKGFVLYDSPFQEVHSIEVGEEGSLYIGCLNEKIPQRFAPGIAPQPAAPGATPAAPGVTITVTDASQAGAEPHLEPAPLQAPFARGFPGTLTLRSAIYRVAPDLSVETLWSSRDEDVFDILSMENRTLFSTDAKGRIYELLANHNYSLLAQTNEAQASRLLRRGGDVFVATSNVGKLFQLTATMPSAGTVESAIKDAQFVSKWGIISWQAETPPATVIQFFTRSGNSDRPDATWSDWSAVYTHASGDQITSPSARFLQWKAELKGSGHTSPTLDSVTVAYLPQNMRPEITSIAVTPQGSGPSHGGAAEMLGGSGSDMESKGGVSGSESSATMTVTAYPSTPPANRVAINWQAEDKNRDTLEYSIYIRGVNESNWRLLKKEIRETSYSLDPETLPDGRYRVRVVASDAPSNPAGRALTSEIESAVFLIDNTPPKVEVTGQAVDGNQATVHFRAIDAESNLRRAEFSLDGAKWSAITSDDGIVDSRFEEFTVQAGNLAPGEHVLAIRVYDFSGNPGLAKAVVTVSKK